MLVNHEYNDHYLYSKKDWQLWLKKEEQKTCESVIAKPITLISAYENERSIAQEYSGRELIELIQNASDQSIKDNSHGRILVNINKDRIIICNTGRPFSTNGIQSLQNAYTSPKKKHRSSYIGNKGLGFRSILNWSKYPIILSGHLKLAYSRKKIDSTIKNLSHLSHELAEMLHQIHDERKNHLTGPILPFPDFISENPRLHFSSEKEIKTYYECQDYQFQGYDTVIAMIFNDHDSYQSANDQVKDLRPEFLLFVKSIEELRLINHSTGENHTWSIQRQNTYSLIKKDKDVVSKWTLYEEKNELPDDINKTSPDFHQYEISIAIPEYLEDDNIQRLFSFFPTEETFPLPITCHATLELDQSRKHILDLDTNKYILDRLAFFIANVAENFEKNQLLQGFQIIKPSGHFSSLLTKYHFENLLVKYGSYKKIIPTISNIKIRPCESYSIPMASSKWLPTESFADIAASGDDEDLLFFGKMGVRPLTIQDIIERLKRLVSLSKEDQAKLVYGIASHLPKETHLHSLLGSLGEGESKTERIFLGTKKDKVINLPNWSKISFMSLELQNKIMEEFGINDPKKLTKALFTFDLKEYTLTPIVTNLIRTAENIVRMTPRLKRSIWSEVMMVVFQLFQSSKSSSFPENCDLMIPCQTGDLIKASSGYLGRDFGREGKIMQQIYHVWAPNKLISMEYFHCLTEESETLEDFLLWIGCHKWPQLSLHTVSNHEFSEYILKGIEYPLNVEDYVLHNEDEATSTCQGRYITIQDLESILKHASPEAITSWIALDIRSTQWCYPSKEHGEIYFRKKGNRKKRIYNKRIPSYIRWFIAHSKWIPTRKGQYIKPDDIFFEYHLTSTPLSKYSLNLSAIKDKFELTNREIQTGLRNIGLHQNIQELEAYKLYQKLQDYPKLDTKGLEASEFYRALIETIDPKSNRDLKAKSTFIKKGKMFGSQFGSFKYFPVSDLYFQSSRRLPDPIVSRFKTVALPRSINAKKVEDIFGIKSLDSLNVQITVTKFQVFFDLNNEFQKSKPFMIFLQKSLKTNSEAIERLIDLTLCICISLKVKASYQNDIWTFELPKWEWIIDKDVLYITCDPKKSLSSSRDFIEPIIGKSIASLFDMDSSYNFQQLFAARDENREEILREILGLDRSSTIENINSEPSPEVLPEHIPLDTPNSPSKKGHLSQWALTTGINQQLNPLTEIPYNPEKKLRIRKLDHKEKKASRRIHLKVRHNSKVRNSHTVIQNSIHFESIENMVMDIEREFGRYPLYVGHITGTSSAGCDVLSFSSLEDLESFESTRSYNLVNRFIEVKSKKQREASIELKGNGLKAAKKWQNRYFIYRVLVCENHFSLRILRDPLSSQDGIEESFHIHLGQIRKTEEYDIIIDGESK